MSLAFEPRFADLLELSNEAALSKHFDRLNHRWLRVYAIGSAGLAILFTLYSLATQSPYVLLLLPAANLGILRWLLTADERPSFQRNFRHYLTGFVLVQLGFLLAYYPVRDQSLEVVSYLAALVLIPFRFDLLRSVLLYAGLLVAFLIPQGIALATGQAELMAWVRFGLPVLFYVLCALVHIATTRRDRSDFANEFRVESSRHRDSKRMRQELDYARQIQLQMLPQGDPKVQNLDICGICLPATEVGGDYYEYFRYSKKEMAVVIGDVAGHGVASGLLLSGVRSCLYLLQSEALGPRAILNRLNLMLRDTNESRMFISMLHVVIDHDERRLCLSSAGHPPLLFYSHRTGYVTETAHGPPPLGTRLEAGYVETEARYEAGDVFLMLTDGLHETRNSKEEMYGSDRLAEKFKENAHKDSRGIREAILGDVWNFKGNAEQEDDVTLVVIRAT